MKTTILKTIAIVLLFSAVIAVNAQDVPPPPPPGHNQQGNQEGGRGPIGEGLVFLLGLGGMYRAKKLYNKKKHSLIDD
jgi:hypothetical protein